MTVPRDRGGRKFAPLPPGIVRVRLEGESAPRLLALLAALPGVAVVTGPDSYPGDRLYVTVAVLGEDQGGRFPALPGGDS